MSSVLDAWQAALAAEYTAAFGYSVLGPHLPAGQQMQARTDQQDHRDLVSTAAAQLDAAGATPVPPQSDYPVPAPLTGAAAAQQAAELEQACAAGWRYVIAVAAAVDSSRDGLDEASIRSLRVSAQSALTAAAVRAVRWRRVTDPAHATVPFPGM